MNEFRTGDRVLGAGRGSMATTLFGALWLGLSMAAANALTLIYSITFAVLCIALVAGSLILIRRGRLMQKAAPASLTAEASGVQRQFKLVSIFEGVAIAIVILAGSAMHRPELITLWISIVVGVHFLPLARIFQAPVYYATGAAICAWAAFAWLSFRSASLAVAAGLGAGMILWLTAALTLVAAARLLRQAQSAAANGTRF